jgi:hypothetical protein
MGNQRAPMLRRKRSQNGERSVTDRFAFVRFVARSGGQATVRRLPEPGPASPG